MFKFCRERILWSEYLTPCRTLTSLIRDNNFGPNMDITSQTCGNKCGPNVIVTSHTRGMKIGPYTYIYKRKKN